MNKNLKIKDLTLYSFIALIVAIIANSVIMFYFINNVKILNEEHSNTMSVHNSFLKTKLYTEKLLISTDFDAAKKQWTESLQGTDNKIELLNKEKKKRIDDLIYICNIEIQQIQKMLNNKLLSPYNLQTKSIVELKGELHVTNKKNSTYILLLELTKKVNYLLQYQAFILDEFTKIEKEDTAFITSKIHNTLLSAIGFPLTISLLAIVLATIIHKYVKGIERNLLTTQTNLNEKVVEIENAKLLLNNIINTVPMAIFWKGADTKYLGANQYFLNNAGLKNESEIIGKTDYDMPWAQTQAKYFMEDDKEVIESKKAKTNIEETLTNNKNETIYLITSKVPLTNKNNEIIGVLGVYIDVTKQKKMAIELSQKDKLLAQQSKMASMGEMLENIAHQWRQPLSVISTAASGMSIQKEYELLTDEEFETAIEKILKSTDFLSQTIDDFRNYFKTDKNLHSISLAKLIDKSLYLLQSKFKNRDINVILDIPEQFEVMVLENEFIQAIMNILNNANDALEHLQDKPRLLFINATTTNCCTRGVKEFECSKECIVLTIKDNAGGIPENILDRIFEPYFTTKHKSQGTGIGLYMTEEMIVKHMDGSIGVANVEYVYENLHHKGAEFTIILPQKEEETS